MQDLGSREGIAKAKSEITIGLKSDGTYFPLYILMYCHDLNQH
jgi:UDP-N-acetylmuramyl pentapeptide synthase